MDDSAKSHNDRLMVTGYNILKLCKEDSIPCILWGGGAIYHFLGGKLDYRKMSDLEFFLPKKADHAIQQILKDNGFYGNWPFNNMQNMSRTPRREFYCPNRELTSKEIEEVEHGRKDNVEDVEFQKIELFTVGIRMCWTFNFKSLPDSYQEAVICPPGFQLALKANAVHPDDFDLKDIQDISSVLNSECCERVEEKDSIFREPILNENLRYSIGTEIFEHLAQTKHKFPSTVLRNFSEVQNYSGLSEQGREKLSTLLEFLKPLERKDRKGGFLSKARKEKPQRVDARHI